ncbi:histidine phosphatase family protein [Lactobacillus sp. ESL0225]|nr:MULTISPECIES: histidine phosphatase family protein [unclassified Lactobacillus]RMC46813.1 histidine phosphatase family protein [Lactobacillus sp. ESL0230]RMC49476.1 histidine phosphatase family protein [Lactobacillus sp. ESL0225]
MMKSIYLVRHGQTLFNVQHKIQGFCDSPLTELGIKQAQATKKEYFEKLNIPLDEAHSSTSERAVDTLKLITNLPFKVHKDLREWNFGTYEGEGEHLNPPLPYNDFFVQFGGESQRQLTERINQAITTIVTTSTKKHILIVSHGAAIANFYKKWAAYNSFERKDRIKNCSVLKYNFSNGVFHFQEIFNPDC